MAWLLRFLAIIAAAITSLFVARDALNFGIIEILLMVTLIIGAAVVVVASKVRREFLGYASHFRCQPTAEAPH